jgi:hypothetical protein
LGLPLMTGSRQAILFVGMYVMSLLPDGGQG